MQYATMQQLIITKKTPVANLPMVFTTFPFCVSLIPKLERLVFKFIYSLANKN